MASAVALGNGAIALVAFLTVGREGLETAAIMWSTIANAYSPQPFIGATLGIIIAILLGIGIYRGAIKVNLGKFFTITGFLLIIVAAGVLAYGVYDLQEAGFLPRLTGNVGGIADLGNQIFNIESTIPKDSWYGTLLKGTVNFQPDPSWLQGVCWAAYLGVDPAALPAQAQGSRDTGRKQGRPERLILGARGYGCRMTGGIAEGAGT